MPLVQIDVTNSMQQCVEQFDTHARERERERERRTGTKKQGIHGTMKYSKEVALPSSVKLECAHGKNG